MAKTNIVNKSDIPDKVVHEIQQFCQTVDGVKVVVKNGRHEGHSKIDKKEIEIVTPKEKNAQAYPWLFCWGKTIELRYDKWIEEEQRFKPWRKWKIVAVKNPLRLPCLFLDRIEEFVGIMAHEYRHQWQRQRPLKSEWVFGARKNAKKPAQERDAGAYEIKMVRKWRKLHRSDAIHLGAYLEEMSNWTGIEMALTGSKDIPYCDIDDTWDLAWCRKEDVVEYARELGYLTCR